MSGKYHEMTGKPNRMSGKTHAMTGKPDCMSGKPYGMSGKHERMSGKPYAMSGKSISMTGNGSSTTGNGSSTSGKPDRTRGKYHLITVNRGKCAASLIYVPVSALRGCAKRSTISYSLKMKFASSLAITDYLIVSRS